MKSKTLFSAKKGKQISVFLENRPGTLAALSRLLAGARLNILAMTVSEGLDHGYVRLVADRHTEAARRLKQRGFLVLERVVLLLEMANRPGSLAEVTRVLAEEDINVEYLYCANSPAVDQGLVVLRTADPDRALRLLKKRG